MFRGLFIGIDRYKAPVTRLSCARTDAVALATLFEDTHGGDVRTLIDGEATRDAIVSALTDLHTAAADDFVMVSFSGHGTEGHELVPVDVDPYDLAGSCISLNQFATLLDQIPSANLLVILDCCFAGGFGGARVFAPSSSRAPLEDRSVLEALVAGQGRIVVTASASGEPALETMQFGHGLLTYYLVEGLQGREGLGSGGRLRVMELLDYVTRNVVEAAHRLSETQTPTVYGSIEGAPALAILSGGTRFAEAFPDRVRPRADATWSSLQPYGFTGPVLDAWAAQMQGLNELQLRAINEFGVLDRKSLLVVAPTGSGKTMIGELAAMRAAANGGRAVMLLPLKALVNDKYEYMTRVYGDQLVVARATGDHSDQVGAILSGQFDVALLTYEKFLNLVLGSPYVMRGLSVVVVDEVQTISDPNRGPWLEFLMTLLRSGHARGGSPQVVALSAVIGDTQGFEIWLGGSLLRTHERPVPLRERVLDGYGTARTLEPNGEETAEADFVQPQFGTGSQSSKPWIIPLVRKLVAEGKKVIVFRSIKAETVGTARYLADSLGLPAAETVLQELPTGDRSASSDDLRSVVAHGIGFHNADLDRDERMALEAGFRDPQSPLRVLVATTTLAMGVNTPAEVVVVAGFNPPWRPTVRHFRVQEHGGTCWSPRPRRSGRVVHHRDVGDEPVVRVGSLCRRSARGPHFAVPRRRD